MTPYLAIVFVVGIALVAMTLVMLYFTYIGLGSDPVQPPRRATE